MNEWLIILFVVILLIFTRVKSRGFFWRARDGEELSFRQFMKRWKDGVINITPLQQTKTTLWSFIPVFAGIIWGIVITLLSGIYWMSLILAGSFPITFIQFISNIQKYKSQKQADDAYKMALTPEPKAFNSIIKKKKVKKKRRKK